MREIKFRIYHNNQMHFNAIVGNGQVLYIPGATGEYKWVNEAECKAMQFTSLIDKNGKEIYEGDIINCIENDEMLGDTVHGNCIVIFDRCAFFYCPNMNTKQPHQILYWASDIEVIGNIHETKQL